MGTTEADAKEELEAYCRIVLPTVEKLHAWYIEQGYNFDDKA